MTTTASKPRATDRLRQRTSHENMRDNILYQRKINRMVMGILRPHNLDIRQWVVLGLVSDQQDAAGSRITDLAASMEVRTTYITAIANHLCSLNLISRIEPEPGTDQRERRVTISPLGRQLLSSVEAEISKANYWEAGQ